MTNLAAVAIGAGLALGLVLLIRRRGPAPERRVYALGLFVAAAVYVGFALWARAPFALLAETAGLGAYGWLAWLGWQRSARFLFWGWAAHVFWDVLLHPGPLVASVPAWYPPLCVGFDWVVAIRCLRLGGSQGSSARL